METCHGLWSFNGAGPRRARRGGIVDLWGENFVASMGPGHGGPGEEASERACMHKIRGLQWGRATEGPESTADGLPAHRQPKLQWGRATEGPESEAARAIELSNEELQWGRATEGPESCRPSSSRPGRATSFNGAGPRRARRACCRRDKVKGKLGFNGAGHGGPGESRIRGFCEGGLAASMGPGHGGPGEGNRSPNPTQAPKLQWGRATEGPESLIPEEESINVSLASMGPGHGGPGERALLRPLPPG